MSSLPRNLILRGDVRRIVPGLLPGSVDAVITSPPYFQLRDYGVPRQLGLEGSIEQWVKELRDVFRAVAQVLKPGGCLWLNLGDTYSRRLASGAPRGSLLLAPERLLLALSADGWLVRNKVVWAKRNPMPESVTDRLATTWEGLYLLTRSRCYFFDLDAIRAPHTCTTPAKPAERARRYQGGNGGLGALKAAGRVGHQLGKNPGDVWSLPKATYRGEHFATFPEALIERPILATVPERICVQCDTPWRRQVTARKIVRHRGQCPPGPRWLRRYGSVYDVIRRRGALIRCGCGAPTRPGVVLDPFFGTGTVGVVAHRLGRDWLGIELKAEYIAMASARLGLKAAVEDCPVGGRTGRSFCPPPQPSTTSKEVGS